MNTLHDDRVGRIRQWYVDDRQSVAQIARRLSEPIQTVRETVQQQQWVWRPLRAFVQRHRGKSVLVFDLETSGLPRTAGFNRYLPYTDLDAYASSRILQLAYCRFRIGEPVARDSITSVFRAPEGFRVSPESEAIHKLSTEWLLEHGRALRDLLPVFLAEIERADFVLAHNAGFDVNILKSEMIRLHHTPEEIEALIPADKVECSCALTDFTRLSTLYGFLPAPRETLSFHDARDDVFAVTQIINFLTE